mgnify:CR=1 FL=1
MYRSTRFASPRHILWCGLLVYGVDKLTLDKIVLKNRKSLIFQCFQAIFQFFIIIIFFFLNTSTCNSPNFKLHCFEFNTLSSITPFLNLAYNSPGLMAFYILMRNELVEVCRVGYFRAPPENPENFRFYVDTNRIQNEMLHLCYKKCI